MIAMADTGLQMLGKSVEQAEEIVKALSADVPYVCYFRKTLLPILHRSPK